MVHFGDRHRVGRNAIGERADESVGQSGERCFGDGAARQSVFQDTQVDARFARFLAQSGHVPHGKAAVFSHYDGLGLRNFSADLGHYGPLLLQIKTQGLSP
jgi:hypothetical protein